MISEGQRKNSKWTPYLNVLPQQLDSLVFWSESELSELQASSVKNKIGKADAEEIFAQYIAPLRLENCGTEMCHRVASVIMAYAFDIPEEKASVEENTQDENGEEDGGELVSDDGEDERTILSMIPLADMLNADADRNNARLSCDNEDLEMRTTKPIAKGEEVFNDYGQLPRSDLLRRYGYITENYSAYDVAEISTESILSAFRLSGLTQIPNHQPLEPLSNEQLEKRVELAEREGVYEDSYDLAHRGPDRPSIPDELLALLYLCLLDEEHLAAISSSQSPLPSRSRLATEVVGQVLVILLQLREKEYSTTLEEDEKLLQGGRLAYRMRMAVEVRLGEKKVLREAIHEATSFAGSNKRMRVASNSQDGLVTRKEKGKRKAEDPNPQERSRYR